MKRYFVLVAAAAVLVASCAPSSDTGMAGCYEPQADGRFIYRADVAPMRTGWCPTRAEAIAVRDMDAKADAAGCITTACKLRGTLNGLVDPPR